jgi:TPR repeat protein
MILRDRQFVVTRKSLTFYAARGFCSRGWTTKTMKRIAKHAIAAVILMLSVSAPGVADENDGYPPFLRENAARGDAHAQYLLGTAYYLGKDVVRDAATAVTWFRKAANQGDAEAQATLGLVYITGIGVPQDYVMAHMWLNLAGASAKEAVMQRDSIAKMMTPAQIAEAQKLAREWRPK